MTPRIPLPRFEPVLVHSTTLPDVEQLLREHGYQLKPVNDIRHGHAHVLVTARPRDRAHDERP